MQYQTFKGTAREFIAAEVTVNDKPINQPALSLMAQYGVAKIVGEIQRPLGKKGHNEKIYSLTAKSGLCVGWNPEWDKQKDMHEGIKELSEVLG